MKETECYRKRAILLAKVGALVYIISGVALGVYGICICAKKGGGLQSFPWNTIHITSFFALLLVFLPLTLRVHFLAKKAEHKTMAEFTFYIAMFMAITLLAFLLTWVFVGI